MIRALMVKLGVQVYAFPLSGATILGDGSVTLIVDARNIIKESVVEEAACAAGHATN